MIALPSAPRAKGRASFLSSAAPRLSVVTSSSRAVGSDATLSLIESRFRGAIAASLDAFFLCESVRDGNGAIVDFKIVELNERGEQFLGRPRSELIDQTTAEIMPSIRESGLLDQLIDVVDAHAAGIDQFEAAAAIIGFTVNAIPRDARFVTNDRTALTQDGIKKRRFPDVGPAHDDDGGQVAAIGHSSAMVAM